MGNTNITKILQPHISHYFLSERTCLTVEFINIGDMLALTNDRGVVSNNMTFGFENT